MEYLIGIYILYVIIKYIASYPERKRLREYKEVRRAENAIVREILNGFDVNIERERIIKLLLANWKGL